MRSFLLAGVALAAAGATDANTSRRQLQATCSATCPDNGGDGVVGVDDLLLLLASYGSTNVDSASCLDSSGDGRVGVEDLLSLLAAYGNTCDDGCSVSFSQTLWKTTTVSKSRWPRSSRSTSSTSTRQMTTPAFGVGVAPTRSSLPRSPCLMPVGNTCACLARVLLPPATGDTASLLTGSKDSSAPTREVVTPAVSFRNTRATV